MAPLVDVLGCDPRVGDGDHARDVIDELAQLAFSLAPVLFRALAIFDNPFAARTTG